MIPQLVLASRSPRRSQLLTMLGISHVVAPSEIDETRLRDEAPEPYALRLAEEKARAASRDEALVLGADTAVVIDDLILGKPRDEHEAERMLAGLSGRTHRVVSAIALLQGDRLERAVDVTHVTFDRLDPDTIRDYVATGEPLDKAGAYGIQGFGAALVRRIDGDFFGVMGLPVRLVLELLARFGYRYCFTR